MTWTTKKKKTIYKTNKLCVPYNCIFCDKMQFISYLTTVHIISLETMCQGVKFQVKVYRKILLLEWIRFNFDTLWPDHIQWQPPTDQTLNRTWPFTEFCSMFHRTFATGVACRQGTLTPPDIWSRPFGTCTCSTYWDQSFSRTCCFFPDYALRISLGTFSILHWIFLLASDYISCNTWYTPFCFTIFE